MIGEDLTGGVQLVVDANGNVTSVVLTPAAWHALIGRIEDDEDRALLAALAPRLRRGPEGALSWLDVEHDWT